MPDYDFDIDDPVFDDPILTPYPDPEQPPPVFTPPDPLAPGPGIPTGPGADNPYVPPPGGTDGPGYGGPGTEGPGGDAPGSSGPQFDWQEYIKNPEKYLAALLGALPKGSNPLDIFKSIGLTDKNGNLDLNSLLSIAALFGGQNNQSDAIKDATARMEKAAGDANKLASEQIGGARGNFTPYMDAGKQGLTGLLNFDKTPLGSKFVATGGGAAPPINADWERKPLNFADLARLNK